uniref:Ovule protein n=1 Tax=Haemonchus placei TaxID=6290 RepID=A0A0N4W6Q3_HAEPC
LGLGGEDSAPVRSPIVESCFRSQFARLEVWRKGSSSERSHPFVFVCVGKLSSESL